MNKLDAWLIPDWPVPGTVKAVTTLRTGGVSAAPYAGFNLAAHVGDVPDAVAANRAHLAEALALPAEPKWLAQTHSNLVVDAALVDEGVCADASYTDQPGVVCAVMTADCLPVLLCSRDGRKIAAVHAGWRGLAAGIISNTVAALNTIELWAWLGPAIGPKNFAVGDDVRQAFITKSVVYAAAFADAGGGRWWADIYQLARIELAGLGVTHIYGGEWCTVADEARFFSYRRDQITGRMATLIWRF